MYGCKPESDPATYGGGRYRFFSGDGLPRQGESREIDLGEKTVRFTNASEPKDTCT